MSVVRHASETLCAFAQALLARMGVRGDIARDVAEILVEGDLLGHDTHGLAQLPGYLAEVERGAMLKDGAPTVVNSRAASQLWDGHRLPGPWLTLRALEAAIAMAKSQGTGTITIRRSHHIACLAAYHKRATDRGLMLLLMCSDPTTASVAPFGGVTPVLTPNPLSAGIPTTGDPVLLDISASYTTNGLTNRLHQEGGKLAHAWLQDAQGQASADPAVLFADPKGTLLPLGGHEAGHKGYAMGLLVEALTAGLTGFGRVDPPEGWGATVFLQVLDPDGFGGQAAYARQMGGMVDKCHAATPRSGGEGVRLPGERGLRRRREQLEHGVELHPTILPALRPWAERLGVALPA